MESSNGFCMCMMKPSLPFGKGRTACAYSPSTKRISASSAGCLSEPDLDAVSLTFLTSPWDFPADCAFGDALDGSGAGCDCCAGPKLGRTGIFIPANTSGEGAELGRHG